MGYEATMLKQKDAFDVCCQQSGKKFPNANIKNIEHRHLFQQIDDILVICCCVWRCFTQY